MRLGASAVLLAGALLVAACGSSAPVVRSASAPATTSAPPTNTPATSSSAPSSAANQPAVVVTPARKLAARQVVTVKATGFKPGEALQIVQCAFKGAATGPGDCNLPAMQSVAADASGALTSTLTVVRGPFGTNKIVCGRKQACLISVTQAALNPTDEADMLISFATP